MNLDTLKANIKALDFTHQPATSEAELAYFRYYSLNFEEHSDDIFHHFGHFPCDRFDIVAHYYEHKKAEKTCFILHGYFDHAGLYSKLIDYCLQRQFSVVIFDLPGHGLSTGERACITSFSDYEEVLRSVLFQFDGIAPGPWYAIGQSTGGAILMDYILSGGEGTFTKTVLLAPLYRPRGWFWGRLHHAFAALFIKRIKRQFAINSHDQAFLDFLKYRDPLQYHYLSMNWVAALKLWLTHFDKLPYSEYAPLIIQGKKDTTVDWQHNIPVIKQKFPRAKTYFLEQGRHHLANEDEQIRTRIYSAIDMYFEAR